MSKINVCRICDESLQTGCDRRAFSVNTDETFTIPEQSCAENVTEIRLKGKISD